MAAINLEMPYKRDQYIDFLRNDFLPDDFEVNVEDIDHDLDRKYKYIKKVTLLGKCTPMELKVYEIRHDSANDPRVSLTRETFNLMTDYDTQNVLAFYTSKEVDNFRFSYVTMDKVPEGKRVKTKYSNPRRYSFFLGPQSKTSTPKRFLIDQGRIEGIKNLRDRFSIEVVNKEFYQEIAALFTELVKIIKLPSIEQTEGIKLKQEFAVRMIGRIIFCWFLKKKTTKQGIALIPDAILSLKAVKKFVESDLSYYHNILEKLFFQVLNKPIEDRLQVIKDDPIFSIIPFLNGGLFEHQQWDFYDDVNETTGLSNVINGLKINNTWFEKLFEILERFNFTIDENTSMDVDLSVDPEMLGRIFENLLAEINPETGDSARKSTGSYYTPRPIVEYMVDESLIQYLKTKTEIPEDKLRKLLDFSMAEEEFAKEFSAKEKYQILKMLYDLKIIDPACGSGAFPMGILQKIVLILERVDDEALNWTMKMVEQIKDPERKKKEEERLFDEEWNYRRKLGIIQNSIYGVDNQQIAIEISKLRVFLSLVVDAKVEENRINFGISPLPNLEFKFVTADSLIKLKDSSSRAQRYLLDDGNKELKDKIEILKELRDQYFDSYGTEKDEIKKEFDIKQKKLYDYMLKNNLLTIHGHSVKLSDWKPFSNNSSSWFDPEWMFGIKKGFDIVIANPPYVQIQNFSGQDIQKEWENQQYETFTKTGDIYCLFYEKGYQLLKPGGIVLPLPELDNR
jgi:hypothetical protein